jgi:tetratricopeptide (TPR) repeat protein
MSRDFIPTHNPLSRERYLLLAQAALAVENYRFAGQALLKWLAYYPGDLTASLYYSRALLGQGRPEQALVVLDGLCMADPEFVQAAELLLCADIQPAILDNDRQATSVLPGRPGSIYFSAATRRAYLFALTGRNDEKGTLYAWGSQLRLARQALESGDLDNAGTLLERVLGKDEISPLACVTHLQLLSQMQALSLQEKRETARDYHLRWPDCLACMLWYADWSMEAGRSGLAVALMHQAAARDVSGQVASRLWGAGHPYRSLWPERPELQLELPVPADVAAALGWNRLPAGSSPSQFVSPGAQRLSSERSPKELDPLPPPQGAPPPKQPAIHMEPTRVIDLPADLDERSRQEPRNSELHAIEDELDRLGGRLNLPSVKRLDGRFPVYVVFSLRGRLQERYGKRAAEILEAEMKSLVEVVQSWHGWGACLFFADDPAHTRPLKITPSRSGDPWELKLILADLDEALGKRGERIGALLIVGGPEVVPFHHLPNPVDDQDVDVPSDNPYATCDENYFIPEWPVGRLPGGCGDGPKLLLTALRRIRVQHATRSQHIPWRRRVRLALMNLLNNLSGKKKDNFGYSAAIWQRAATSVFRTIGKPEALHVSPPMGYDVALPPGAANPALKGVPSPVGVLGYFNLHGLVDAPEWYGQRDPSLPGPDYPVALRPQDIQPRRWRRGKGNLPQVIFSEACYGLHIQGRALEDAISLKFLEAGCLAVVGSTCVTYGSVDTPLSAADLLAHSFWRYIRNGVPAGEALRQAKIYLASEMNRRQDFLDGEDQKTLISFILYGDPLVQPVMNGRMPKTPRYRVKPLMDVKTVCDRADCPLLSQPIPEDVMVSVKNVVARYLPGMADARLTFAQEGAVCDSGQDCPSCRLQNENDPGRGERMTVKGQSQAMERRRLVTLSKQVTRAEGVHTHYARLTLNEQGELIKLVVSR